MARPRACSPAAGKVTRASRNDVAVDADAKAVVVLILDLIDRGRLGRAGQSRERRKRPVRCRFQLLVDHIEAHIEPRCEVVLGPGTERPPAEVVVALPVGHLDRGERDRAADRARSGERADADVWPGLALQIARLALDPYSNRP